MLTRILILLNGVMMCFLFFGKKEDLTIEIQPREYYKLPTVAHSPNDLCNGTLGENIFTDGDFGSGNITDLPDDPIGYAPGYTYQSNPPPNDGYYIISNNTTAWGSFASTWIDIGDNSNDPNGYMMVVNASYDPGIFYQKFIVGLCENTVYQFSADVINLLPNGGIKPNLDFWIDGEYQFGTGDVPTNSQWNSYGFTFTTNPGTTTLTLSIRNNAPGGQGNDLALDNISFQACGPDIGVTTSAPFICNGQPISIYSSINGDQYDSPYLQWQVSTDNGENWEQLVGENESTLNLTDPVAGEQFRLLVSASAQTIENPKCRVVSNVSTFEIAPTDFTRVDTLCQGLELQVGNSIYNSTGVYVDSLVASYGCDSIVTTYLEIAPNNGITADIIWGDPVCNEEGSGYVVIENIQNGSGQYSFSLDGQNFQTDPPFFENLSIDDYTLTILDSYGCEASFYGQLVDPLSIAVDLGEDVTVLLGCEYELDPQINFSVASFEWSSTFGMECLGCLSTTVIPTEDFTYKLVVTDLNGCTASDSITIKVDKTRHVFIPNAFSPDDDGLNDFFFVNGGKDVALIKSLKIFNRWGGLVFSNNDIPPNAFDGGWNGRDVDMGVYIYVAEILFVDGVVEVFSGDVTVTK